MKSYRLAEPETLEELLTFLAEPPGSTAILAGGTDLMGLIKDEILSPDVLIDLSRIKEIKGIKQDKNGIHLGALTTLAELISNPLIQKSFPGLRQAALSVGSPQLRNVGTVGGNLCQRPRCWYFRDPQFNCRKKGGNRCFAAKGKNKYHAILGGGICYMVHPSDLAPALISLEARVKIASAEGEKELLLEEFFAPPAVSIRQENKLQPNQILTEIILPPPSPQQKSIYLKFTERGSWDFAVVSVAAAANLAGKSVSKLRVVLGGVAPIPWRLAELEKKIQGHPVEEKTLALAAVEAMKQSIPLEENGYKIDLAGVLITRALTSLAS